MSESTSSTMKFVIDASAAKTGAADFESAITRIRAAVQGLESVKVGFNNMQKSINKMDFSKISKGISEVNKIAINPNVTREIQALASAFASMRGPSQTAIANIVSFGKAMNGLHMGANANNTANALASIARALNTMGTIRAPSGAAIRGIQDFAQAIGKMPNLTGQVQNAQALANITNALSRVSTFRSPSAAAIAGLQAFAAGLAALPASNGGIAVARTLVGVSQALAGLSNFRAPTAAAINNLKNFASALSQIKLPANVASVASALTALGNAAGNASGGFARLRASVGGMSGLANYARDAQQASVYTRRLEGDMRGLENAFSATYQAGSLLRAAFSNLTIAEFGKQVFDAANEVQTLQAQLSVTSGAADARQQLQFLNQTSDKLGLSLDVAYEQWGRFVTGAKSAGASTKDAETVFYGVGSAMAVMGVNGVRSRNIMLALTEMFDKGKVTAQQMTRQLGMELPGAMMAMEDAAGKHGAAFTTAMKKGEIGLQDLIKFGEEMKDKFAGGVAQAVQRASSQLTILNNQWTRFKQAVGEAGVMDAFAETFNKLSTAMKGPDFTSLAEKIGKGMSSAIREFGVAALWAVNHAQMLLDVIKLLAVAASVKGLATLGSVFHMVFSPVLSLTGAISGGLVGALRGASMAGNLVSSSLTTVASIGARTAGTTIAVANGARLMGMSVVSSAIALGRLTASGALVPGVMFAAGAALAMLRKNAASTALALDLVAGKVATSLNAARSAVLGFGMSVMTGGITLLVNGLVAAAAAAYLFRDHMVEIGGSTSTLGSRLAVLWDQVKGYGESAADGLKSAMNSFFAWIDPKWQQMASGGGSAFDAILDDGALMIAGIQKAYDQFITSPVGAWVLRENDKNIHDAKRIWNPTLKGAADLAWRPDSDTQSADATIAGARTRLTGNTYAADILTGLHKAEAVNNEAAWNRDARNGILSPQVSDQSTAFAGAMNLNPDRVHAYLRAEAGGISNVSPTGAYGVGQMEPGTMKDYGVSRDSSWQDQLNASMRYFGDLLKKFGGNYDVAEAAYNAGPSNKGVEAFSKLGGAIGARGILPKQTQDYLARIDNYGGFQNGDLAPSDKRGDNYGKNEQDTSKLEALIDGVDKYAAAQKKMIDLKTQLDIAVAQKSIVGGTTDPDSHVTTGGTLITQQLENKLLEQQRYELADALDPAGAMLRNLQEQLDSRKEGTRELFIQKKLQEDLKTLTRAGDTKDANDPTFQKKLGGMLGQEYDESHPAKGDSKYTDEMTKLSQEDTDANVGDSRDAKIDSTYDGIVRSIQKADPTIRLGVEQLEKLKTAVAKLYDDQHPQGLDALEKGIKTFGASFADLTKSMTSSFEDAFVKFAATGKFSMVDLLGDLRGQLAKFLADQILKKFLSALGFGGPSDGKNDGINGQGNTEKKGGFGGALSTLMGGGGSGGGGGSSSSTSVGSQGGTGFSATDFASGGAGASPAVLAAAGLTGGNGSSAATDATAVDGTLFGDTQGGALPSDASALFPSSASSASSSFPAAAASVGAADANTPIHNVLGAPTVAPASGNGMINGLLNGTVKQTWGSVTGSAEKGLTDWIKNGQIGKAFGRASDWVDNQLDGGASWVGNQLGLTGAGGLFGPGGMLGASGGATSDLVGDAGSDAFAGAAADAGSSGIGSMLGSAGSWLAGLFSEGGMVGQAVSHGSYSPSAWAGAPAYAEGTANTSGIPSILHDNEAVIPLSRGRSVPVEFSNESQSAGNGDTTNHYHTWNVNTKDANSFRDSQGQIQTNTARALARAQTRNG